MRCCHGEGGIGGLTEHELGHLHDGAPYDNAETETFGECELETVDITEVEVPDERGIAFLQDKLVGVKGRDRRGTCLADDCCSEVCNEPGKIPRYCGHGGYGARR